MHKINPKAYGLKQAASGQRRPFKSPCDDKRPINPEDANRLLKKGIELGLVSTHRIDGLPKYVWAVDEHGDAYEAKIGKGGADYHGYRLRKEDDDAMRQWVVREWNQRAN